MLHKYKKKGFTLIELIVVMAVIGILVLLSVPKFIGHTKEAKFTKLIANTKQLEIASERYYMDKQEWPRLSDESYIAEQIEAFTQKIYDSTGKIITLDPEGSYYDIDYSKLNKYVNIYDDKSSYIIQNPVGNIYALEGVSKEIKDTIKSKLEAIIEITEGELYTNTEISFTSNSTSGSGDIIKAEWRLDNGPIVENIESKTMTAGEHVVELRITNKNGIISDWTRKAFTVYSYQDVVQYGMPGQAFPEGTIATANSVYSTHIAFHSIDKDMETWWNGSSRLGWIQYDFPEPIFIKNINICAGSLPSTIEYYSVYGKKDGSWILLANNVSRYVDANSNNNKPVILNPISIPPDNYQAIKIDINGVNSWVAISELTIN